jgi:secreted PhoX family phosphatase
MSGPAAGHRRLQTAADPAGRTVIGTMGNCAGGVTPWGTVITAEENFRYNFGGYPEALKVTHPEEVRNHARYGFGGHERRAWYRFENRFHIEREPREPNRFGWMVEFDPYDPESTPRKLSALGRYQHEGCSVVVNEGEPAVVYMGDDGTDEYLYRYVSRGNFRAAAGAANSRLFDNGTLYVAKLKDDGTGTWLPLVHGNGPLTRENGFADQGDVLIDARIAADHVDATPMDRPEDVEVNPMTGRVYAMLTKNPERSEADPGNPRPRNRAGHIVELLPPGEDGDRDHLARTFRWDIFLLAGDPGASPGERGSYGEGTSSAGWFCNPDNIVFDPAGRIWMATDNDAGCDFHDGLWAAQTTGPQRAVSRHFFGCPRGAELCGPCFTPDGRTLFVSVQHPADDDNSTFLEPSTRWPDFAETMPPRPAVVAITHRGGKSIGS